MINQSTLELLKAMKLTAMANELQHQMEDPATYAALGFEDRLSLLTDAEWGRRQANKLARYIKNATFSTPSASIEGIECKLRLNGMPVPLLRNGYSIFNGTKYR